MTLDQYRASLSRRIDRLIAKESIEEARRLLSNSVEALDGLIVTDNLETAGDVRRFLLSHRCLSPRSLVLCSLRASFAKGDCNAEKVGLSLFLSDCGGWSRSSV